ncbi:MAG: hypothetical protein C0473_02380 [Cyanobacteria bacterium DS3.002]|nr:hypothetical protein [Cyanobacteria bacterium DS3.002]MBA4049660.1 hypothetical protein [Cyanobacteria bacterium DS2.008]
MFNISPANAYTVLEVVQVIKKSLGCPHLLPVIENNAPGEIRDQCLDGSKTQNLVGWMPAFDLGKGVVETITWYRKCLEMQPANAYELHWEKVCHV